MPVASDREVFERFASNQDVDGAVSLLAFARYAQEKYEWERHIESIDGKAPSIAAVSQWIREFPDARLDAIKRDAITFWEDAAAVYMADRIDAARQAARDDAIVTTVRAMRDQVNKATSFSSTFWPNLVVGVTASFAFALLILLAGVIFEHDPSPFALLRHIQGRP